MSSKLLERTLDLVNSSPGTLIEIGNQCGVSPKWLFDLKHGIHKAPDVVKVERVYVILSGKQLEV